MVGCVAAGARVGVAGVLRVGRVGVCERRVVEWAGEYAVEGAEYLPGAVRVVSAVFAVEAAELEEGVVREVGCAW